MSPEILNEVINVSILMDLFGKAIQYSRIALLNLQFRYYNVNWGLITQSLVTTDSQVILFWVNSVIICKLMSVFEVLSEHCSIWVVPSISWTIWQLLQTDTTYLYAWYTVTWKSNYSEVIHQITFFPDIYRNRRQVVNCRFLFLFAWSVFHKITIIQHRMTALHISFIPIYFMRNIPY